jgi:CRP-like cAMP-binding protein
MTGYDIVHVAVAPPNILEANLVKEVAAILNKDLYGTRLLLAGRVPRIVAHYQTIQAAESTAQSLRALGLVTVVCSDSELRKPSSASFKAHTLKLEKGEVIFLDKSGDTRRIKAENVFLILKGTIRIYTEKEATVTRMKFSLPATVLTGGIPIWRKVKEKTKEGSIQTECFVRLYERTSLDPILQIFQNDLEYSFLEAEMAASSVTNLNALVTKLRNMFPRAVFDDRLTEIFGVDVPFVAPGDEIEINCKLIYLYHEAVSSLGPSA